MPDKRGRDNSAIVKDAITRAVKVCGSYEKLADASENVITKWAAIRMKQRGKVLPDQAIAMERATGGMVNRLEFFPDLIHGNPGAMTVVRRMLSLP